MMFASLKYSMRSSSLILILTAVTVLISTLPTNCEATAEPNPDPTSQSQVDDQGKSDTLSNEELHQLLGLYTTTASTTSKPSFFPTSASPKVDNPNRNSENENDKSKSSELIQSLNLLNALLGSPGDSADVSATAAILNAAKTTTTTTTTTSATPTVKSEENDPTAALQSLAILNSLLGLGQTPSVPATTGSAANLAAAAALLGLGGLSASHPQVRQAQAQQAAHNHQQASAAMLTNLLLAQAGLALPYAQPLTQPKSAVSQYSQQDFPGFTNTQTNLDMAASQNSQLGGLINLLGTLGSLGQSQPTQSPLASLFNFGQQQIPKQQPDYLSALFGQDQKQIQEQEQVKQQQLNSNILASLLGGGGGGGGQQSQQNLLANLLASGSANSPLSLFGNQSPAPSLLSSLGTIGSSAFQLVGNTLSGLSGTRPNGKPRVRGVDTRVGLGYRMGPNADAQLIWEIGPQIFTDPITNEVKPIATEKPGAALQKRFELPPQPPINLLASGSQNVPRYKPGFRLSPHPSLVNHNNNQNRNHNNNNNIHHNNRPYFRPTPSQAPDDNSNSRSDEDRPVMLTAYEKWLANNDKGQGQQQRPHRPQPKLVRRILHYPNVPVRPGLPAPRPVPLFPRPNQHQNRILRVGIPGQRRPPVFPKPQQYWQTPIVVQRSGQPNGRPQMSMFRPNHGGPAWPAPPSGHNPRYNPWQNFVPDSHDSYSARNAGVVDPKQENDRSVDVPVSDQLAESSETDTRRITSIEPWMNPDSIMNSIRGGYDRLKFGLLQRTTTTPAPSSKEKPEMVPSLFEHLKKQNLMKKEKEDEEDSEEAASVVKIGGDLSYEQLMDSFIGSGPGKFPAPTQKPPTKIKFDERRKLELKPTPDHVKNGATDRPIDPPVEMFIDIENGEVSVRKSIGSIDMTKPWVPTTPRPKTQDELDDEESQKIFQDVQDHLKSSFEQFKFDQELQKATKIHKEKLKAGLDDSMGLVNRYFDLMDATKRKRDVSASIAPALEPVSAALVPVAAPSTVPSPVSVDTETVSKMFQVSKKCNVQPCNGS